MSQRHQNSRNRPPRRRDELRMERRQQLLDPAATFSTLCDEVGLDPRLRKALARLGYVRPTLVQSRCLPLAINSGRDLLVRARTGSGKTLAYCLPVLDKILRGKREDGGGGDGDGDDGDGDAGEADFVRALVLVPTRELCHQVHSALVGLTHYCDDVLSVAALAGSGGGGVGGGKHGNPSSSSSASAADLSAQEAALRDRPDLIVSTPAGILRHVRSGQVRLRNSVESIVVDEADLVLSFGYRGDVEEIVAELPKICQGYLLSATLSPELERTLKRVVLHSPAVLRLEDGDDFVARGGAERRLTQFHLTVPPRDKYLVLYVFLKLGLLRGKGLFFVNDTDGGYRLKLFLEQFHIKSAVLNAELPARSRWSVVEQFNAGIFDYLIATDESADVGRSAAPEEGRHGKDEEIAEGDDDDDEEEEEEGGKSGQKSGVKVEGSDGSGNEEGSEEGENEGEEEPAHEEKAKSTTPKNDTDEADDGGQGEPLPITAPGPAPADKKKNKKRRRNKKDAEYGVSRGVDFRGVSFVVNVDFPPTASSYAHRVGRTARGGARGVALSLVDATSAEQDDALRLVQADQPPLLPAAAAEASSSSAAGRFLGGAGGAAAATTGVPPSDEEDDVDGEGAEQAPPKPQPQPSPLDFDLGEIEGFRYRVEDVGRAVTRIAVREARASELKAEMANSERLLRGHFAENPNDLRLLRHDRTATHTAKVQEHLKHVPKYMLPRGMQVAAANKRRKKRRSRNNNNNHHGPGARQAAGGDPTRRGTGNDPLRSYRGDDVNLDGVVGGDEERDFFDDGGGGTSAGGGDKDGDNLARRADDDGGSKVFLDTTDGTGRSTAGRNAWKQRHGKGKFSGKRRRKDTGW